MARNCDKPFRPSRDGIGPEATFFIVGPDLLTLTHTHTNALRNASKQIEVAVETRIGPVEEAFTWQEFTPVNPTYEHRQCKSNRNQLNYSPFISLITKS